MKRVLREFFRLNQAFWNNYDIVVRVHKCFGQTDFTLINSELAQLTKKFIKQSNAK
ncbi:MAG: Ribonuclease [Burkholderiales bacterium]|jgi:ribonuclease P protein component|nr:Ribonuclease [Burkholderiales bacterium]MCE3269551.1 Ribonuclease [Burkholderiales bacterium]